MEIKHEDSTKNGSFYIEQDGKTVAKMTYIYAGSDKIIIDHTEVSDVLRGQSAGKKMVLEAVAFAEKNHLKIIPLCPFAKSVFDKNPALHHVLN